MYLSTCCLEAPTIEIFKTWAINISKGAEAMSAPWQYSHLNFFVFLTSVPFQLKISRCCVQLFIPVKHLFHFAWLRFGWGSSWRCRQEKRELGYTEGQRVRGLGAANPETAWGRGAKSLLSRSRRNHLCLFLAQGLVRASEHWLQGRGTVLDAAIWDNFGGPIIQAGQGGDTSLERCGISWHWSRQGMLWGEAWTGQSREREQKAREGDGRVSGDPTSSPGLHPQLQVDGVISFPAAWSAWLPKWC